MDKVIAKPWPEIFYIYNLMPNPGAGYENYVYRNYGIFN